MLAMDGGGRGQGNEQGEEVVVQDDAARHLALVRAARCARRSRCDPPRPPRRVASTRLPPWENRQTAQLRSRSNTSHTAGRFSAYHPDSLLRVREC